MFGSGGKEALYEFCILSGTQAAPALPDAGSGAIPPQSIST